jgi:hypothetical protein
MDLALFLLTGLTLSKGINIQLAVCQHKRLSPSSARGKYGGSCW